MGPHARRDPTKVTHEGAVMTDEKRLVVILEVDHSGALAQDELTGDWIAIYPIELMQKWRHVKPLEAAA